MWGKKSTTPKSKTTQEADAHFALMSGKVDHAFEARVKGYAAKRKAWDDWTSGKTDVRPWDA